MFKGEGYSLLCFFLPPASWDAELMAGGQGLKWTLRQYAKAGWRRLLFSYKSSLLWLHEQSIHPSVPLTLGMVWLVLDNKMLGNLKQTEAVSMLVWSGLASRFCHLPWGKYGPASCWLPDEETHGTVLNPTYSLEPSQGQLSPVRVSRSTFHEWKLNGSYFKPLSFRVICHAAYLWQ